MPVPPEWAPPRWAPSKKFIKVRPWIATTGYLALSIAPAPWYRCFAPGWGSPLVGQPEESPGLQGGPCSLLNTGLSAHVRVGLSEEVG